MRIPCVRARTGTVSISSWKARETCGVGRCVAFLVEALALV